MVSNDLTHEFEHQTNLDLLHERQPLYENYGPYNGKDPGRKAEQLLRKIGSRKGNPSTVIKIGPGPEPHKAKHSDNKSTGQEW